MRRRDLLQSVGTAAVLLAAATPSAKAAQRPPERRRRDIVGRDGTRLYYRDWGTGRPIVLVAPWSLSSRWWDYHLASLSAAAFRCVAFDRRGHGRSDEPNTGYDFDSLADDLLAVITTLDLRDVLLVGHSMGAAEVVRYLARHRAARVTQAALVATITPLIVKTSDNPAGAAPEALELGRQGLIRDRPGVISAAAAGFFGAPKNPVSAATMDSWTRAILDGCSLRVMIDLHRAMTTTDFRPDLKAITVPTLLIHGDADTSARLESTGRPTRELLKGGRLTVYEGAAHGLVVTHAERLHDDLIAFAKGR